MIALVIDDSRAMRAILRRQLRSLGHEVLEAADGQAGLDLLAGGAIPDFILVDWHMPRLDGIGFVQAARTLPYRGHILMVTTETEPDRIAAALAAGADEYVMKPFDASVIGGKLALLGIGVADSDAREVADAWDVGGAW